MPTALLEKKISFKMYFLLLKAVVLNWGAASQKKVQKH